VYQTSLETPLGTTVICGDEKGISSITVSDKKSEDISQELPLFMQDAVVQLQEYFSGKRKQFSLKLNPEGTDFQKKVWNELLTITFGKTVSYKELSLRMGDLKSIRAVAAANGKNPLWIVVPCHRVIGSDGSLTGYAGGLWRKKWLLEHENPLLQTSLF
jgi:methylated-DNA-[protein]-cysteine S-methyltransferase